TPGPTVTLYEIVPAPGIRISKIKGLADDIALSLAALGIRIIAPIPGKGTIGIEVPNSNPQIVSMKSMIESQEFQNSKAELPIVIGKTIENQPFVTDLAKAPHLLMAGATGQGKSVGLNAIVTSLLYRKHPAELKFVFVDPKKVELSLYSNLERHYLAKIPGGDEAVITDVNDVEKTLRSLCVLMDQRYNLLKDAQCKKITEYNEKFIARRIPMRDGHGYMPYIVVVIDEFADLIMTAGKRIEEPICRLAQLARAVGIHLIIATQRPSVDIITGKIKANFPARAAFKTSSMVDSKTILDTPGAEQLIGRGDMLFSASGKLTRLQCALIDTPEIESLVQAICEQQGYPDCFELPEPPIEEAGEHETVDISNGRLDPLFEDAAICIVDTQHGSTSTLQRKFAIGYNRAGKIVDQLESAGIVGPFRGSKPREVLVQSREQLDVILEQVLHR
ncbi:MAG: DNA translocase FtsK, partial [Bacteroidales bacterium]|nr:DNA translocase FtsK [Bacteroidales bacterium]MDY6423169.1 DNA translocase FtsK [Bacteroidales bacterium]